MKKLFSLLFIFSGIILSAQTQTHSQDSTVHTVKNDSGEVFTYTEVMPVFPGEGGFKKFLADNIKYPADEKKKGVQGTVYVSFSIEKNGSVSNVKIKKGIPGGAALEAEVLRVVQLSPPWVPGTMNGHPVRVDMTQSVKFDLSTEPIKKKRKKQ
jgi:protein TonB